MNDLEIIRRHGGPAKLAELLKFDKKSGTQRVFNWMKRGIPPAVKLSNPKIFMIKVPKNSE